MDAAASVAGLVSLAGQLYTIMNTFVENAKDAPSLAHTVHSELTSCHSILTALQTLYFGTKLSPNRAPLISLGDLYATLTEAVLLYSELETVLKPLAQDPSNSFARRARWARQATKIQKLVERLQRHKLTINLQLTILQWSVPANVETGLPLTVYHVARHKLKPSMLAHPCRLW